MATLNLKYDGQVITAVLEGGWVHLPTGVSFSPAYDGWSNEEGYSLEVAPQTVLLSLSFAQLMIGLVTEQWITEVEGEAWLAGTLPEAVLLVIESLPAEQRFAAKARALRPSEVLRNDPLVAAMGTAAGKTEVEIDTFFQTYAGV